MFVWGYNEIHKTLMQLEFDGLDESSFNVKATPNRTEKKKKKKEGIFM